MCELHLTGTPVGGNTPLTQDITQDIQLFGPGDIIGVRRDAPWCAPSRATGSRISSPTTSPPSIFTTRIFPGATRLRRRNGSATAALDCADRAEPGKRVSAEGQEHCRTGRCRSSPSPHPRVFPPADELGRGRMCTSIRASRRVRQANSSRPDMSAVLPRVQAILNSNPDLAYSRLLCPRRLDVNTGYHAFVMPAFESGRLAGLGQDPIKAPSARLLRPGRLTPASRSRRTSPITTAGTSAPEIAATSRISSAC